MFFWLTEETYYCVGIFPYYISFKRVSYTNKEFPSKIIMETCNAFILARTIRWMRELPCITIPMFLIEFYKFYGFCFIIGVKTSMLGYIDRTITSDITTIDIEFHAYNLAHSAGRVKDYLIAITLLDQCRCRRDFWIFFIFLGLVSLESFLVSCSMAKSLGSSFFIGARAFSG